MRFYKALEKIPGVISIYNLCLDLKYKNISVSIEDFIDTDPILDRKIQIKKLLSKFPYWKNGRRLLAEIAKNNNTDNNTDEDLFKAENKAFEILNKHQ